MMRNSIPTRRGLLALLALLAALSTASIVRADIRFNEIYVNPPGNDDNREFIELTSTTGGFEPLTGLVLVIVDSAGATRGGIDDAYDLSTFNTGGNGLLLLGNNFPVAPIGGPYNALLDPLTAVADPTGVPPFSGMGPSDLNNNGFSLLLVTGYSSTVGTDLDTNDDGVLDSTPWTSVVDSVGWQVGSGGTLSDVTYAAANLSQSTFTPDSVARLRGDLRANTAAAWYGGDIGAPDTVYDVTQNFGLPPGAAVTPGAANLAAIPEPGTAGLALFAAMAVGWLGLSPRSPGRGIEDSATATPFPLNPYFEL